MLCANSSSKAGELGRFQLILSSACSTQENVQPVIFKLQRLQESLTDLENNLQGKAGYYRNRRQGEYWYALVYGAYPSANDANAAVADLPVDLRKWSPWVRKMKVIQRLMNN